MTPLSRLRRLFPTGGRHRWPGKARSTVALAEKRLLPLSLNHSHHMPSTNPRNYDATPSRKVAFLGLGVMGYPMAGHLALAGHSVTVFNRTASKAQAWCAEYGHTSGPHQAATPRLAAQGADIVFCCVGNDEDLRSVTLGADGAFAGMAPGSIFVDQHHGLCRSGA